jgi:hypothetical protein
MRPYQNTQELFNWYIHFDNKFYYCYWEYENHCNYQDYKELFLPDKEAATIFFNKTKEQALAKLKEIQDEFPNVELEISTC